MNNKKSTKKALLTSVLCLLLCCSMLIGTTFAWFTDAVTSGMNVITAGNLDVELYHSDKAASGEKVTSSTKLFDDVTLWEPGAVVYENLQVKNEGNLALKYQLALNFANATANSKGGTLADVLKVAVVPGGFTGDREAAKKLSYDYDLASFTLSGKLEADQTSETYGIVIYWEPSDNDNDYNMNNGETTVLTIDLGIGLYATQEMYEEDSFGEDYDAGAYLSIVTTAEELKSALENNESVQLGADIVLTGEWEPIGDKENKVYYTGTLDGNGYTISGLTVSEGDYVALIEAAKGATIKNLTVAGSVTGANAAGIVARVEGETVIENCVSNVTVVGTTKAGGIACNVTGANAKITNCINNGAVSGGDYGIGGIVGYVNNDAYLEITNCENNGAVTSNNNKYAGAAVGYAAGTSTGLIKGFTNSGTITGTLSTNNRYLLDGETVLCGYVGTVGNWEYIKVVTTAEELAQAVADGNTDIYLADGEYNVYGCGGKTLTISGSENAVIKVMNDGENGCDYAFGSSAGLGDITFNGVTIDTTSNTGNYKGFAYMKGTFNDCNFVGAYSLNNANDFVFNRCTFDFKNGYFWTWAANSVTFNDCTFNGNSKTILAHGGASTVITIDGCTFAATEKGYTGSGDWTSAVEIDPTGNNIYTINITDSTINENYSGWVRVKDNSNGHIVTINEKSVVITAADLQKALDAATGTSTITLGANITGDVTVTEKDGVNITIDGNGKTFAGAITVDGNSARNTGSLTIQNVNFNAESISKEAYINLGVKDDTNTRYIENLTVKGCTFSGTGNAVAAVKSHDDGDKNLKIEGCTVNSGMHSMLQVTNVGEGLTITDCKVYSKNGINLNYTPSLTMSGCEFDVTGYAVRIGVNGSTNSGTFTISNSTLTSANDDGDAVIILRGTMTGATLTLTNTTLNGTPDITGDAIITKN